MSWSKELGCHCDTSEYANWVSGVVEFRSVNLNFSSTGNWASQGSDLRKSWWVEENEFKTFRGILVVESKLELNAGKWWLESIWWTLASEFSRRNNLSWLLSKRTENTESIVGIIDIVEIVEGHEVVSSQSDGRSSTNWCKIRDKLLHHLEEERPSL